MKMKKNRLITTPEIVNALASGRATAVWKLIKGLNVTPDRKYQYLGGPETLLYAPEPGYLNHKTRTFIRAGDKAVKLNKYGPTPVVADVSYDDVNEFRDKYPDWEYRKVDAVPLWAVPNWFEIVEVSNPILPKDVSESDLKKLGFAKESEGVYSFPGIVVECETIFDAFSYVFNHFFSPWKEVMIDNEKVMVSYVFDENCGLIEVPGRKCITIVPYIELYLLRVRSDMV